jgi:O-antigen ligase
VTSDVSTPLAGRRASVGLTIGLALTAPFALAGAIGIPLALLVAAIVGFPRPALWLRLARPAPALLAALAFMTWATISLAWSPADIVQIRIAWLEVVAAAAVLLAAAALPDRMRRAPRIAFVACTAALAVAMAAEAVSGGALTAAVKSLQPGDANVLRNLSIGASAAIILIPAAAVMAFQLGALWRLAAPVMLVGGAVAAVAFGAIANLFALGIAMAMFVVAWRRPGGAVLALAIAIALWIALFPLIALAVAPLLDPYRADMPFSWEMRLEIWRYALELIGQRPWFGWGVDSARHFGDATMEMRGILWSRLPLHPHSASLQLWLETGLVGVALVCAAVLLGGWRIARSPHLGHARAAAAASTAVATAFVLSTSYGFWQEWLWCTAFMAAAACFLAGPGPDADGPDAAEPKT